MVKNISHPYPHTRTRPILILSSSLSVSLSQVHAEANAEHEVGVALDGVAEGWVAVERKVAIPPPPRRAVRGIRLLHQVSSPCSGRRPLSLSHHSSPSSSTAQGAVCHGTLTTAPSSSSRRTSKSGRPCRSTRWLRSQAAAPA
jgi:hypothetical protein